MIEKIENLGKKKVAAIVFVMILVLAIPFTIVQLNKLQENRSHANGEAISVILDPLTKNVNVGDTLDVDVNINGGLNNVTAADITFTYDKNFLTVFPTSCPTTPTADCSGSFHPISGFTTIVNDQSTAGTIHFVAVNPTTSTNSGTFKIGTIHLKATAAGSALVGFSNIHVNSAGIAGALPVDTNNTKNGTYTIAQGSNSTPTPTPTGTTCTTGNDCSAGQVCWGGIGGNKCTSSPVPTTYQALCNSCLAQGKKYICTDYAIQMSPNYQCDSNGSAYSGVDAGTSCNSCLPQATPTPTVPVSISITPTPTTGPTNTPSPTAVPTPLPSAARVFDFNDDGKIDELDLNILYYGFARHQGD